MSTSCRAVGCSIIAEQEDQVKIAPQRSWKGRVSIWQAGWECAAGTFGASALCHDLSDSDSCPSANTGCLIFYDRFTKGTQEILMIWIHKCLRLDSSVSLSSYSLSVYERYLCDDWINQNIGVSFHRELHMWYVVLELQHFLRSAGMEITLQNV